MSGYWRIGQILEKFFLKKFFHSFKLIIVNLGAECKKCLCKLFMF